MKDVIKYKGYQVPPAELESLLQTHRDIDEATVVPDTLMTSPESCLWHSFRRPESHLHESHIKEFVAKQVMHYKRIHYVFLVDSSIWKNAAGYALQANPLWFPCGFINTEKCGRLDSMEGPGQLALRRISSKL